MSELRADTCPCCGGQAFEVFWRRAELPVEEATIYDSADEARKVATGPVSLVGCMTCGFAWNRSFDAGLIAYGAQYEGTQTASAVFSAHLVAQIERLRHTLALPSEPRAIELGAGQGEFLTALAHNLDASGVGYDPAYRPKTEHERVRMRDDVFPDRIGDGFDLFVCRMTLEHLPAPATLLSRIAAQPGGRAAGAFLTVPAAERIWREGAFWDIYYEHVNYFTKPSLELLLRRAGFRDVMVETDFGGHYLEACARFHAGPTPPTAAPLSTEPTVSFAEIARRLDATIDGFRRAVGSLPDGGGNVLIWGGGSKAVAFLASVPEAAARLSVVDINPARRGRFLPASGCRILGPEDLGPDPPRLVVVMNENYLDEVRSRLAEGGLSAPCIAVCDPGAAERIKTSGRGPE